MATFEAVVARDSSTYTTINIEAADGDEALEKAKTFLRDFEAHGVEQLSICEGDECFGERVCSLGDEEGHELHEDVPLNEGTREVSSERYDQMEQAIDLLITAYKNGFLKGGSMDWSDVDAAYAAAVEARGTTIPALEQAWTQEGETVDA